MSTTVAPAKAGEVQAFLAGHSGWALVQGALVRTFEAPSFLAGIDFVKAVALEAEAADHHPDIDIRWRRVTLRLITHDAGNAISAKDLALAATSDRLFASIR